MLYLGWIKLNYTQGTGNISIKQSWPSYRYPLSLNICGNPKVSINGNVRLCKLVAGGNAEISLYWINSDDLYLRAMNKARVCLAGTVGTLEAYTFSQPGLMQDIFEQNELLSNPIIVQG